MKNRGDFFEIAEDQYLGKHLGFISIKDIKVLVSGVDDTFYKIPLEYQYRPDLIARYFYGTTQLAWVLTLVNDIENSPEGFTSGRILRVPTRERVLQAV